MPFYVQRGRIPRQRHIVHREKGEHTYEELISRRGFADTSSNLYHLHMPTAVAELGAPIPLPRKKLEDPMQRPRHLRTQQLPPGGNWVEERTLLAFNADLALSVAAPTTASTPWFYRNAHADELIFVHHGRGVVESIFGDLPFRPGDYVVLPRGVTHRWVFEPGRNKLLILETRGAIETPSHFRNQHGQLLEHAPYCERDLRVPEWRDPIDVKERFEIRVKVGGDRLQPTFLSHHPFDLIGWDGFYYPWILSIHDFMPSVGKIHLPPPAHVTFTAPGLVVCSFVPRPFDFHPRAIPIPYAHSNVDSDEVLYYVEGNFMSRRGIESESITLHPMGLPHGPQPGLLEPSIGARETAELAVMVDTFAPLIPAAGMGPLDDPDYLYSWLEPRS